MFCDSCLAEKATKRFAHIVSVYGKVPLYYFIVHFYLVHAITIVIMYFTRL